MNKDVYVTSTVVVFLIPRGLKKAFSNTCPLRSFCLPHRYEIRANPLFSAIPESGNLYANLINCRENSHAIAKALERSHVIGAESCPAYEYYVSGFITFQMLLDYTKISVCNAHFQELRDHSGCVVHWYPQTNTSAG